MLWGTLPGRIGASAYTGLTTVLFVLLRLLAELWEVSPRRMPYAKPGMAADLVLILLVGPGAAALSAFLVSAVSSLTLSASWSLSHAVYRIAGATFTAGAAGLAYELLAGESGAMGALAGAEGIVLAVAVYVALDLVIGLFSEVNVSARDMWMALPPLATLVAQYASFAGLGLITAWLYVFSPVACLLLVLPVGVIHYVLRSALVGRYTIRRAIEALARQVDLREAHTAAHSERVAFYTHKLCRALGLPRKETELIVSVARIHDLGKMNIWPDMVNKIGPLDDRERREMNRHPAYGAEILSGFVDYSRAAEIIMYHHEWYDGTGYPAGLRQDDIPLGARIIAVADAFDAMTSRRPYREPLPFDKAARELSVWSGIQFDPQITKVFLEVIGPEDVIAVAPPATVRQAVARTA